MKTTFKRVGFGRKVMALAILAAFGPAHADDEVADLTQPGSSVGVGVGMVSGGTKDRSLFGQYNGLRDHKTDLLLDLDVVKRDDATGTWTILKGRNLGLDNRDLSATYEKQGDWRVSAGYNEITKHEIRTVNTGMSGAGTTTPVISLLPAIRAGSDVDLSLERKGFTLGGEKWLSKNLLLEIDFKNEDKDGARLFGKGFTCSSTAVAAAICPGGGAASWGTLLLPEPINSTTRQFEAKLNWSGEKFLLSGGYYGSFYQNSNFAITPTLPAALVNTGGGPLARPAQNGLLDILAMPVALPPDNQAHQFYLSGNYDFTPKTKATFKAAYTHATQDESFGIFAAAAPGRSSLGGELNTTLLQFGLSSRPLSRLSLAANVKYEQTEDKTPLAYYNSITNGAVHTVFTNDHLNHEKLNGKLEAGYQFLPSTRGTLGIDYKSVKRDLPVSTTVLGGLSALRQDTDETAYRAELRQTFTDDFSGSLAYSTGKVRGGDWLDITGGRGTVPASALAVTYTWPVTMADRDREKVRLTADWSPANRLSLQFSAEDGKDHNVMPGDVTVGRGNRGVDMSLYSLDATWVLSSKLRMTAFASTGSQDYLVNGAGYLMDVVSDSRDFGFGVVYQPVASWQLGADYSYHNDKDRYKQSQVGAYATGGLPDVTFRLSTLKLYGQYELDKHSAVRIDLANQEAKLHEWTWDGIGQPYFFSDRTTVSLKPDQKVTFVGARYIYKFR